MVLSKGSLIVVAKRIPGVRERFFIESDCLHGVSL